MSRPGIQASYHPVVRCLYQQNNNTNTTIGRTLPYGTNTVVVAAGASILFNLSFCFGIFCWNHLMKNFWQGAGCDAEGANTANNRHMLMASLCIHRTLYWCCRPSRHHHHHLGLSIIVVPSRCKVQHWTFETLKLLITWNFWNLETFETLNLL
jgi:hypothetical protein